MGEPTFTAADEARMILGKISDALGDEFESNESDDVQTPAGGSFEIAIAESEADWKHKRYRVTVEAIS